MRRFRIRLYGVVMCRVVAVAVHEARRCNSQQSDAVRE